jgi:hypothetical protein
MIGDRRAERPHAAHDREASADEALEAARKMPPGPERNIALKKVGQLRNEANAHGLRLARRGRPPH